MLVPKPENSAPDFDIALDAERLRELGPKLKPGESLEPGEFELLRAFGLSYVQALIDCGQTAVDKEEQRDKTLRLGHSVVDAMLQPHLPAQYKLLIEETSIIFLEEATRVAELHQKLNSSIQAVETYSGLSGIITSSYHHPK